MSIFGTRGMLVPQEDLTPAHGRELLAEIKADSQWRYFVHLGMWMNDYLGADKYARVFEPIMPEIHNLVATRTVHNIKRQAGEYIEVTASTGPKTLLTNTDADLALITKAYEEVPPSITSLTTLRRWVFATGLCVLCQGWSSTSSTLRMKDPDFSTRHKVWFNFETIEHLPQPFLRQLRRNYGRAIGDHMHRLLSLCSQCEWVCGTCGERPPTDPDAVASMTTDQCCPSCARGKLIHVRPPKPTLTDLRRFRSQFRLA